MKYPYTFIYIYSAIVVVFALLASYSDGFSLVKHEEDSSELNTQESEKFYLCKEIQTAIDQKVDYLDALQAMGFKLALARPDYGVISTRHGLIEQIDQVVFREYGAPSCDARVHHSRTCRRFGKNYPVVHMPTSNDWYLVYV